MISYRQKKKKNPGETFISQEINSISAQLKASKQASKKRKKNLLLNYKVFIDSKLTLNIGHG